MKEVAKKKARKAAEQREPQVGAGDVEVIEVKYKSTIILAHMN